MEHIFRVIDASIGNFEVNDRILQRLQRKEFGRMSGINVMSWIESFEKRHLYLSTQIKYIGIENDVQHAGLTSYYLTICEFFNADFFKSEPDDIKLSVLEKCFHIAEAHAYAMMADQATEHGLKTPLMEPTPAEKIREWSMDFISKQ
ncbi:hypothetical protein IQ277_29305 [Nostocales cyanobacterium LEGE 12452]|nr:hypothetical protein [Nostocales cyanobacterium LEGE 12452]